MWAEQFCEGSRNQRIKRDAKPMHTEKFLRKLAKHTMWVSVALLTGITFVGYFSPIREMVLGLDFGMWELIWIAFFTSATYLNAGYMREQVCMYMCPYARFQSAMFDPDTLIVSYDEKRGEPRGARKKNEDPAEKGLGSCTDCQICVQVCPTGIDIRNGLQYECINCALCIDACDSVMDQMGYERGLISYTTENALNGKKTHRWHPRFVGYLTVLTIMVSIFITAVVTRVPLELDVIRDRDRLYNETFEGFIENSYTLKLMNMTQQPQQYQITVEGLDGVIIKGETRATLAAGEVAQMPIRLQMAPEKLERSNYKIHYHVEAIGDDSLKADAESRFIGPAPRR
jgi:cytochrome c oxidase accessory protein FixG